MLTVGAPSDTAFSFSGLGCPQEVSTGRWVSRLRRPLCRYFRQELSLPLGLGPVVGAWRWTEVPKIIILFILVAVILLVAGFGLHTASVD